jgi:hypothetical protein
VAQGKLGEQEVDAYSLPMDQLLLPVSVQLLLASFFLQEVYLICLEKK